MLKTQKPKVVVLELYWDMLDDKFEMKQANSFFEVLNDDNVKKEYIKEVFPINEKVKYSILPIRYQQDYFAYEADEIGKNIESRYGVSKPKAETNGTEYYLAKGYTYCDTVIPDSELDETNQFKGFDGSDWEPDDTQLKYINKIAELCKENDIELVLVTAPIANVSMDYITDYNSVHDKMAEIAENIDAKYIDFNIINSEEGLLKLENFRDDAHLNDSGVKIVDKYFVDWLVNNTEAFGKNNVM